MYVMMDSGNLELLAFVTEIILWCCMRCLNFDKHILISEIGYTCTSDSGVCVHYVELWLNSVLQDVNLKYIIFLIGNFEPLTHVVQVILKYWHIDHFM